MEKQIAPSGRLFPNLRDSVNGKLSAMMMNAACANERNRLKGGIKKLKNPGIGTTDTESKVCIQRKKKYIHPGGIHIPGLRSACADENSRHISDRMLRAISLRING